MKNPVDELIARLKVVPVLHLPVTTSMKDVTIIRQMMIDRADAVVMLEGFVRAVDGVLSERKG